MSKSFQNPKLVTFCNLTGWPRSDPKSTDRLAGQPLVKMNNLNLFEAN